MRRHVIKTTKILAIALTAAGCATNATPPPATSATVVAEEPPLAVAIEDAPPVEEIAAVVEAKAEPVAAPAAPAKALTAEQEWEKEQATSTGSKSNDPTLLALRDELQDNFRAQKFDEDGNHLAATNVHYRPLCDAQGYPLVGNVLRKSGGVSVTQLCRTVRRNEQASK